MSETQSNVKRLFLAFVPSIAKRTRFVNEQVRFWLLVQQVHLSSISVASGSEPIVIVVPLIS